MLLGEAAVRVGYEASLPALQLRPQPVPQLVGHAHLAQTITQSSELIGGTYSLSPGHGQHAGPARLGVAHDGHAEVGGVPGRGGEQRLLGFLVALTQLALPVRVQRLAEPPIPV